MDWDWMAPILVEEHVVFRRCILSTSDSILFPKWGNTLFKIFAFRCNISLLLFSIVLFVSRTNLLEACIVYYLLVYLFVQLALVCLLPFCLGSCLDYWPNGLFVSHKWPSLLPNRISMLAGLRWGSFTHISPVIGPIIKLEAFPRCASVNGACEKTGFSA